MDSIPSSMLPESPRKRPAPSEVILQSNVAIPTSPNHSTDSPDATNYTMVLPNGRSREPSPALSTTSSLTSLCTVALPTSNEPPAKRRKLTPAEKVQRQAEKAELKARKEEQKLLKDKERQQKSEVKEEKRRERELEKQKKDQEREEEKRRREEETEKKQRTQPRILNFFAKPIRTSTPIFATPPPLCQQRRSPAPQTSDYERAFLPFSQPSFSRCAPVARFLWDREALNHIENMFNSLIKTPHDNAPRSIRDCISPWNMGRSRAVRHSVRQIMSRLIDIPPSQEYCPQLLKQLRGIPIKYIYFHQDIRPAYVSTYTRNTTDDALKRAARNPLLRVRDDTDYDYDSEAEWEEPEEGEDVDSDGESDGESVDTTDDMAEFLDDENAEGQTSRRRPITVDMEPICSGIHWEDENGAIPKMDATGLCHYRMLLVDGSSSLPIDPYSTRYWMETATISDSASMPVQTGVRQLQLLSLPRHAEGENATVLRSTGALNKTAKSAKGPPRLLSGADLDRFKEAVRGSPHSKQGLLAILKKETFPTYPNIVLKDTLETVAARVGRTETEKKWAIVNGT